MSTPSSIVGEQYSSLSSPLAELLFAVRPDLGGDLGGVLAGRQPCQGSRDVPVQPHEVRVDARPVGTAEGACQRVVGGVRPVPGTPDHHGLPHPVALPPLRRGSCVRLSSPAPSPASTREQVLDDGLRVGARQRVQVTGKGRGPLQVPADLAPSRHGDHGARRPGPARPGEDGGRRRLVGGLHGPLPPQRRLAGQLDAGRTPPARSTRRRWPATGASHRAAPGRPSRARSAEAPASAGKRAVPQVVVGGDVRQAEIADLQQAGALQVGHRHPPAPVQVEVDPQVDDRAQCPVGPPAQVGGLAGGQRILVPGQAEGAGDLRGDVVVVQAILAVLHRLHRGPVQRAADHRHLDEVVEVPGLQRRVLPVVDEGEQLSGVRARSLLRDSPQAAHDGHRGQRGRRRPALGVERGQLGEVTAANLLVGDPAAQAEAERPGDERSLKGPLAPRARRRPRSPGSAGTCSP